MQLFAGPRFEYRDLMYPPPPWTLCGFALVRPHTADTESLRRQLPDGFEVVNCWQGQTLGGTVVARYGEGSTLEYSELIEFGGTVRCGRETGLWVSRIMVDLDESVAGGREIWGLPKEHAEFEWSATGCTVRRGDTLLYSVSRPEPGLHMPFAISFPALTFVNGSPAVFKIRVQGQVSITYGLYIASLQMVVDAPSAIKG